MKYREACPNCNSENYEITDYSDEFDMDGCVQWWDCMCEDCGRKFSITKVYTLSNVIVEEVSEG